MSLLRRNIDDDQAARDIEVLDAPSSARASVSAPTPMEVEKALEGGMSNAQGGSEGEGFETPRKKAKGSGLTEGDQGGSDFYCGQAMLSLRAQARGLTMCSRRCGMHGSRLITQIWTPCHRTTCGSSCLRT